jgi:pimeloyl-ACP methyl ester carboxylesterase
MLERNQQGDARNFFEHLSMPSLQANRLTLEYESVGDPAAPAILLIMGLGMPAAAWPLAFVIGLVERGFRTICFDNRDAGNSTKIGSGKTPNLPASIAKALLRLPVRAPYNLDDMAADTAGLLDALALDRVHMVGVSMGGMIAQVLAARYPERVTSLTSIMSSSGNPSPRVALGKRRALQAIISEPADPTNIEAMVDHFVRVFGMICSPAFPTDVNVLKRDFERVVRRGLDPQGTKRQLLAILASGDRRALIEKITAPTLVIHGADDPLVPVAAGRDTAAHIRGAKLEIIAGMGHDFAPGLLPRLVELIVAHCREAVRPASAPRPQALVQPNSVA